MSNRQERANAEIQKAISEIVLYSLNDPRFSGMVNVTSVKISADFKYAKVFISVSSNNAYERKEAFKVLKGSGSAIRTMLVKKVKLPQAPQLDFVLDEGNAYSDRVNEILEDLVIPPLEEEEE